MDLQPWFLSVYFKPPPPQKKTHFDNWSVLVHLRFIDEHFLGSGWLPDVPDAQKGAAVKQHVAVWGCRNVDGHQGVSLGLNLADAATCDG